MNLTLNFTNQSGQLQSMVFTEGLHAVGPLRPHEWPWLQSLLPEHVHRVPRDPLFPEALLGCEVVGSLSTLARYGVSYLAARTVVDMCPEERRILAYICALERKEQGALAFEEPDAMLEVLWRSRPNPGQIALVLSQHDLTWAFDSRCALARIPRFVEVQCTPVEALTDALAEGFPAHWMRAGASVWVALHPQDGTPLTALHEVLAQTQVRVVSLRLVAGDLA